MVEPYIQVLLMTLIDAFESIKKVRALFLRQNTNATNWFILKSLA